MKICANRIESVISTLEEIPNMYCTYEQNGRSNSYRDSSLRSELFCAFWGYIFKMQLMKSC